MKTHTYQHTPRRMVFTTSKQEVTALVRRAILFVLAVAIVTVCYRVYFGLNKSPTDIWYFKCSSVEQPAIMLGNRQFSQVQVASAEGTSKSSSLALLGSSSDEGTTEVVCLQRN